MADHAKQKTEEAAELPKRGRHIVAEKIESDAKPENTETEAEAVPSEGDAIAADSPAEDTETETAVQTSSETAKRFSLPVVLGIAIAALVAGLLVGMFFLGGAFGGSSVTGKTSVAENELDSTMASYSYKGKSDSITVRDVILQSSSLEAAKDGDGNYAIPTADVAMGVVRNKILVDEAKAQGIEITDEDVATYAKASLGTDDFESIAASYGMDVDAVKILLQESCLMGKLRDTVVSGTDVAMPEPPDKPDSDDEDAMTTPTKEYASYIINLVGDEWDASKDTWASNDGPYASKLAETYEITKDGATYEAATAAYYIAYQQYSDETGAAGGQWTEYVNGILDNATIQLYTLIA